MPSSLLAPADPRELLDRLAALRRRVRFAEGRRGLGALLAVLLAGPALVGLLDWRWHLPPLVRAAVLVALLTAAGLVFAWLLLRPLRRRCDDLTLALRIEARYPALNDSLASTVEFLRQRDAGDSAWLQQATIDRALRQSRRCDFAGAVRTRGTGWATLACLLAAAVAVPLAALAPKHARVALTRLADPFGGHDWPPKTRLIIVSPAEGRLRTAAGQPLDVRARLEGEVPAQARLLVWLDGDEPLERPCDVTPDGTDAGNVAVVLEPGDVPRSFRYRITAGDADSGWRSVELVTPPELVLLDGRPTPQVHLTYPAYTDLPPRDLPDGGRVIKAVVGTVVRLRAATDRPIDHASLIYKPRDPDPTVAAAALAPIGAGDALQVVGAALGGAEFTAPVVVAPAGDGKRVEMTFVPRLTGTYLLTVVDATGIGSTSEFDVRVLPDPAPRVTLERPAAARDSLAVLPDAVLTLAVKAEDQLEDLPGAVRNVVLEYRVGVGGAPVSQFETPKRMTLFDHAAAGAAAPPLLRGLAGRLLVPPAAPLRVRTPLVGPERRVPVAAFRRPDGTPLKPGDSVFIQAVGWDFDDVTWAKEPGRSATVELRVVAPAELEARLQQGQANLRGELLRVQQWQRDAAQRTAEAQRQLQATGRLNRKDMDGLFQAEQLQQRARERVGTDADGLRAEAARQRQALRDNPLPPSPARDRIEAAAGEFERLARELEPIEGLLGEARREDEALAGAGVEPRPRKSAPLTEAQQKQREAERTIAGLLEKLEPWSGASEVRGEARALLDEQRRLGQQTAELQRQQLRGPAGRPTKEQQGELDRAADRQARLAEFAAELRQKMGRIAEEKGRTAEDRARAAAGLDQQAGRDQARAGELDKQATDPKQKGTPQGAQSQLAAQALRERAQAAQSQANDLRDQARALRQERDALQQALAADRTRPGNPEDPGVPANEQMARAAQQVRDNQLGNATASQRQGADALERAAAALDERQAAGDPGSPQNQLREAEKQVGELMARQEELQRQAEAAKASVEEMKRELDRRKQQAAERGDKDELKRLEQQGLEELRRAEAEKQDELKRLAQEQKELERQAKELAERLSRQKSPAAKPVQDAAEQMSRAAAQMEQGDAAERTQDDALDKLDEAQRSLDQQREQAAQGELLREQRAKLLDRARGLQERQKAAVAELERIHTAIKKGGTFPNELAESLSVLRDAEERLRGEVETLAKEKFEGLPVFADFLKQTADALDETAQQIERRVKDRPGADQPLAEADREDQEFAQRAALKPAQTALRRLTQLLDAVKDEKPDRSARKPGGGQPGGGGGGGGGGAGEAIPPKAQLRAIRALQAELNERTTTLAKEFPDPAQRPDEAEAELKALREAQSRLFDLFREFNVPEAPAATPPAPAEGKPVMPVWSQGPSPARPRLEPAGQPGPAPEKKDDPHAGAAPGAEAEILDRLVKNLRDVTRRLDEKDAGADTQQRQKEILEDIDRLLNPPPPPPQDQPPPDQPPMPMDQSQEQQNQQQQQQNQQQQNQQSQGQGSQSQQQGGPPMGGQSQSGGGGAQQQPMGGGQPKPSGGTAPNPQSQPQPQRNLSRQQQRELRAQARQQQPQQGQPQQAEPMAGGPMGSQGQQAGNPVGPRSAQRRPGMPDPADPFKEVWGQLPERERKALDQFYNERFLPRYQDLLRQYYATIAERNGKRAP